MNGKFDITAGNAKVAELDAMEAKRIAEIRKAIAPKENLSLLLPEKK